MKKRSLTLLAFVIVTAVSWASYGNGQASGTSLFGSKCAACHGKDGAGLPNWKQKGNRTSNGVHEPVAPQGATRYAGVSTCSAEKWPRPAEPCG